MAGCGCHKTTSVVYEWSNGSDMVIVYGSEIQAKAKVLRSGGSYVAKPKG